MQKTIPFLWFKENVADAVAYYQSVFGDVKVVETLYYGDAGPGRKGDVMMISFDLHGQRFCALDGNPQFKPSMATSFAVMCDTQEEADRYWDALADGGEPIQCGWINDKFGFSWQIVPKQLIEYLSDPDPVRAERVARAMFEMVKLDLAKAKRAYDGVE